jgi:iron complex outermembrane receptor protein
VVSPDDRYRFENPAPDYFFGFTSNFNYKAFDFSFAGRANIGNYVYNNRFVSSSNYNSIVNSTGFLGNVHSQINSVGHNVPQYFSDYFLENASFLRFDHITAGYRFANVFGSDRGGNLRVYATMQNPFVITNYTGIDPDVYENDKFGIDNDIYPRSRTILFGANLNF